LNYEEQERQRELGTKAAKKSKKISEKPERARIIDACIDV